MSNSLGRLLALRWHLCPELSLDWSWGRMSSLALGIISVLSGFFLSNVTSPFFLEFYPSTRGLLPFC